MKLSFFGFTRPATDFRFFSCSSNLRVFPSFQPRGVAGDTCFPEDLAFLVPGLTAPSALFRPRPPFLKTLRRLRAPSTGRVLFGFPRTGLASEAPFPPVGPFHTSLFPHFLTILVFSTLAPCSRCVPQLSHIFNLIPASRSGVFSSTSLLQFSSLTSLIPLRGANPPQSTRSILRPGKVAQSSKDSRFFSQLPFLDFGANISPFSSRGPSLIPPDSSE